MRVIMFCRSTIVEAKRNMCCRSTIVLHTDLQSVSEVQCQHVAISQSTLRPESKLVHLCAETHYGGVQQTRSETEVRT